MCKSAHTPVASEVDTCKGIENNSKIDEAKMDNGTMENKSYARDTYDPKLNISRKLFEVPTEVDENGYE